MLLITELAHDAADRIYRAIVASTPDEENAAADPAALRYDRLDPLCGFRHDPSDIQDRSAQMPYLICGG